MRRTYTLFQQYIAAVLLFSFCLQSCGGGFDNNPLIPNQEEQIASNQTDIQFIIPQTNTHPILDQAFCAQGGYAVTFYEYKGDLQASVEPFNEKGKVYNGVPVIIEKGTDLTSLSHLSKKVQQGHIAGTT